MPDMQPFVQPATPVSMAVDSAVSEEDFDYALGCECAYPFLQIERWQEVRSGAEPN
jgi:hypothetical protein